MCDRIDDEENKKFKQSKEILDKSGCSKENDFLNQCMKGHAEKNDGMRDWRQCKSEINSLKLCMENQNK